VSVQSARFIRAAKSIEQIADALGLAPRMVISYTAGNIASKLGLPNRKAVQEYLRQ
jgi:DNA-binding CsgD family transcriptional regulator